MQANVGYFNIKTNLFDFEARITRNHSDFLIHSNFTILFKDNDLVCDYKSISGQFSFFDSLEFTSLAEDLTGQRLKDLRAYYQNLLIGLNNYALLVLMDDQYLLDDLESNIEDIALNHDAEYGENKSIEVIDFYIATGYKLYSTTPTFIKTVFKKESE